MKIALDHGHDAINPDNGWRDGGAAWGSLDEGGISRMLQSLVSKKINNLIKNFIPTPTWDTGARARSALNQGCDYYLTIHLNSSTNLQAEGVSAYYNKAGRLFANDLVYNLSTFMSMKNESAFHYSTLRYPNGQSRAPYLFDIIGESSVQAVLLELGFISNAYDRTLYATQAEFIADAIVYTLLKFAGIPSMVFQKGNQYSGTKKLRVAPTEINGYLMLSARDIADMLGRPILYQPNSKKILIPK